MLVKGAILTAGRRRPIFLTPTEQSRVSDCQGNSQAAHLLLGKALVGLNRLLMKTLVESSGEEETCWKIWNAEEDEIVKHFLTLVVLQTAERYKYLGFNILFKGKRRT